MINFFNRKDEQIFSNSADISNTILLHDAISTEDLETAIVWHDSRLTEPSKNNMNYCRPMPALPALNKLPEASSQQQVLLKRLVQNTSTAVP